MFKIKEIHSDQTKVYIVLEDGRQLSGYVLKMDIKNNLIVFLQDGSMESMQFPLNSVVKVAEIQERVQ